MRSNRIFWVFLAPLLLSVLSFPSSFAQSFGKTQVSQAPLWRIDDNFSSTLRLRNAPGLETVTVTPVLLMAGGFRFELAPVSIPAGGVAETSLDEALRSVPAGLRAAFGSVLLEYESPFGGGVTGSVLIVDRRLGLSFTNVFSPVSGLPELESGTLAQESTLEGVWWAPGPHSTGFLAVSNGSNRDLRVDLEITDAAGDPVSRFGLDLALSSTELIDLGSFWTSTRSGRNRGDRGGLRVSYVGRPGEVLVAAGVEDRKSGFSLDLPFWYRLETEPERVEYSATAVLVGRPGRESGFPRGSQFAPFVVLRNTTGKALPFDIAIKTPSPGGQRTFQARDLPLRPFETRQVNLVTLLPDPDLRRFDGFVDISIAAEGRIGDLVAVLGSVDQTGEFVLAGRPKAAQETTGLSIPFWRVGDGDDTVIGLSNPTAETQEVALTIHYNAASPGAYRIELELEPGAQRQFSMAAIIGAGEPDANGQVIPADARMGSATIGHAIDVGRPIRLVVSAATLNVARGTCSWYCVRCEGYLTANISPNAVKIERNRTFRLRFIARHTLWGDYDYSSSATWTSADTSKVTVSSGTVSGSQNTAAPVTVTAKKSLQQYIYWCAYDPICYYLPPVEFQANASVTVFTLTTVRVDATSPRFTEIQYSLDPSSTVLNDAYFYLNGTQIGSRPSVTGTFSFTFNQEAMTQGQNTLEFFYVEGPEIRSRYSTARKDREVAYSENNFIYYYLRASQSGALVPFFLSMRHQLTETFYRYSYTLAVASGSKLIQPIESRVSLESLTDVPGYNTGIAIAGSPPGTPLWSEVHWFADGFTDVFAATMIDVPYSEPALPPQSADLRRKNWTPSLFGSIFFAPVPTGRASTSGVLLNIGPPSGYFGSRTVSTPLQ